MQTNLWTYPPANAFFFKGCAIMKETSLHYTRTRFDQPKIVRVLNMNYIFCSQYF